MTHQHSDQQEQPLDEWLLHIGKRCEDSMLVQSDKEDMRRALREIKNAFAEVRALRKLDSKSAIELMAAKRAIARLQKRVEELEWRERAAVEHVFDDESNPPPHWLTAEK